eukprot:7138072-Alexandrium_andersonii.AAC.1
MSASLVGSEMCIRDSAAAGARGPLACCRAWVCSSRPASLGWSSRSTLPVSYTHLTLPTICSV